MTKDDEKAFLVRGIPRKLHKKLMTLAKKNRRSASDEALVAIERHVEESRSEGRRAS